MASINQMKKKIATENELDRYLDDFLRDERFIHYLTPPFPYCKAGVSECVTLIKQRYFAPGTLRSEVFFESPIYLGKEEWVIISLPAEDKNLMKDMAKECGLVIVDAIPTIIKEDEWKFPVNKERLFAFENAPNHPIWHADPMLKEVLLNAENETIIRILGEYNQLTLGNFSN